MRAQKLEEILAELALNLSSLKAESVLTHRLTFSDLWTVHGDSGIVGHAPPLL